MDFRLGFIAPYAELADLAVKVCRDLNLGLEICVGDLEQGVKIARDMVADGVELIISRGGTAKDIAEQLQVPVVEVEVSGFDLVRAIAQAKERGQRIGVIGFENVIYGTRTIADVFSVYIKELIIRSENDVPKAIQQAVADRIDVVVGDVVSVRRAKEMGLGAILVTSGKEAISSSIFKALEIAAVRRQERIRAERFKNILNYSHEGILATDQEGTIVVVNPAGEKILGADATQLLGQKVNEVLPFLQLDEELARQQTNLGKISRLGGELVVQNIVPVKTDRGFAGLITTFQRAEYFEDIESNVRRKAHLQGHVAQYRFSDIVTCSPLMQQVIERAKRYAAVDSTVLIHGETGTGKELLAQSIHNASLRKNKPFVAINCAAMPESLLESELFGYEEGAFTGARKGGKKGYFELAHGGTLFLDEIGEVPLRLQAHLLRVLQEKVIMRLGGAKVIPTDVRIIAATHRDLKQAVDEGAFRRDLYYRLNVLRLDLPPLRERREDIPLLVAHLVEKLSRNMEMAPVRFSEDAMHALQSYYWEGNIRELENIVERLIILKSGKMVNLQDVYEMLPALHRSSQERPGPGPTISIELGDLREMEKQIIVEALRHVGQDRQKASELLGISYTTLWRRLKDVNGFNLKGELSE